MVDEKTPPEATEGNDWSRRLVKAMTKLGVSPACPACGQAKWSAGQDPESTTTNGLTMQGQDTYIPTYLVACRTCGYLRLHARVVIDEALEALDKEGDVDDQ